MYVHQNIHYLFIKKKQDNAVLVILFGRAGFKLGNEFLFYIARYELITI